MNVDDLYMDRESQVEAIEKTFKDATKPITQHYSKPHVHPVEVLPVLPDSNMWKYPCAQVYTYFLVCNNFMTISKGYI